MNDPRHTTPSARAARTPRTFFTSDTHIGHRLMALLRGFGPEGATRDDISSEHIAAHDETLVATWNDVVAPGDVVWHLGDLALKRPHEVADILTRLNGSIRLVLGNHDRAHPLFGSKAPAPHRATLAGL